MTAPSLNIHVKTALTLAVLALLVLIAVAWGWASLTSPFPHRAATSLCVPTTLHPGDRVAPPKVMVSVYNASQRIGLAERTMSQFENQGFGPGSVGNAPRGTRAPYAQVWSSNPSDPAVRLVASRLGPSAHVIHKSYGGPGIVVMVGPLFGRLVNGLPSVKVRQTTTLCEPPTS
jgi:hypothetical protein